jgi:hypothetical protein
MRDDLTSRLIGLGDSGCLLQGPQDFFACHQYGRLAGLDRAAGSYSQRDSGHGFVARHISDDDEIIVTEAIPVVAVSGIVEPKLMRTAPRSYSLSVDLRMSNVPRHDLPSSDCWALNGAAIRNADPKTEAIAKHFFMPSPRRRDENP